jgi:hypothetical protein
MNRVSISLILFLLMLGPALPASAAQQSKGSMDNSAAPAPDPDRARIEKDMAKKANQQRQANLKRDTDQLVKLATELKEYVDKSNENVLSLDVMKKAEEIEKLAHSVKEKMKGSY